MRILLVRLRDALGIEWVEQQNSGILRIHKPHRLLFTVTITYDVLEWFVEAHDDSGAIWPIPDNGFVRTTWHLDEPLEEVFWFSKNVAVHSAADLPRTILLHISTAERGGQLIKAYKAA